MNSKIGQRLQLCGVTVMNKKHLPIYGIGPFLVAGMALVSAIAVVASCYVLKIGNVSGLLAVLLRVFGIIFMTIGLTVWFTGALRSGMDNNIKENRLKTGEIYAWVRNPMYSGIWILISGISLLWHNTWVIPAIFVNWCIMTIVLKATEEK